MGVTSLSYRLDPGCRLPQPDQVYYREIQRAMLSHFRKASSKRNRIRGYATAGSSRTWTTANRFSMLRELPTDGDEIAVMPIRKLSP